MIEIVNILEFKDCIDSENIKQIIYNKKITKEDINELSKNAELEYYDFTRPLYKIIFKPF